MEIYPRKHFSNSFMYEFIGIDRSFDYFVNEPGLPLWRFICNRMTGNFLPRLSVVLTLAGLFFITHFLSGCDKSVNL